MAICAFKLKNNTNNSGLGKNNDNK